MEDDRIMTAVEVVNLSSLCRRVDILQQDIENRTLKWHIKNGH